MSPTTVCKVLLDCDAQASSRNRILRMERDFKPVIEQFWRDWASRSKGWEGLRVSPLVAAFAAIGSSMQRVSQFEVDLDRAKSFSSIETSAGKLLEKVFLPVYGWKVSTSSMGTSESVLDGEKPGTHPRQLATLKSGPQAINDTQVEAIGDAVAFNSEAWARARGVSKLRFCYGTLYGTFLGSNKKSWHALRRFEKSAISMKGATSVFSGHNQLRAVVRYPSGVEVEFVVQHGVPWWEEVSGRRGWQTPVEVYSALIRACVAAGPPDSTGTRHAFPSVRRIIQLPPGFASALLQQNQVQWLLLFMSTLADELVP